MRFLHFLVVALVFSALGCHSPKYLEDLETPALVWTQGTGLCSKIVAVDGSGAVWTEHGCENGRPDLRHVRTTPRDQVDALWAMFDALPFDRGATLETCSGQLLHGFARWEPQSRRGASVCGGREYDDVSTLPESFRSLAEALRGLE
jgi:hypothetical protein